MNLFPSLPKVQQQQEQHQKPFFFLRLHLLLNHHEFCFFFFFLLSFFRFYCLPKIENSDGDSLQTTPLCHFVQPTKYKPTPNFVFFVFFFSSSALHLGFGVLQDKVQDEFQVFFALRDDVATGMVEYSWIDKELGEFLRERFPGILFTCLCVCKQMCNKIREQSRLNGLTNGVERRQIELFFEQWQKGFRT